MTMRDYRLQTASLKTVSLPISVVVPVLADFDAVARLQVSLERNPDVDIVLVDGGNDPRLDVLTGQRPDTRVIRSPPGRARQMNTGAALATGDWLLFLHADSLLPDGWRRELLAVPDGAVGGWFRFALDAPTWQARLIERGVAWRVRLLRLPYGDQGIFVRRHVFRSLGGFADMPLLEDVEFIRRLVTTGPLFEVPLALTTSSRRWRRDGWFRRSARNLLIVSLYFAGVDPVRLSRWYSPVRRARTPL